MRNILLLILLLFPSVAFAATFGETVPGSATLSVDANNVACSSITCPADGTLDSISVYMKTSATTFDCKGCLFSNNSGSPLALLSVSSPVSVSSTAGWYVFVPTATVTLQAGTVYWPGVIGSGSSMLTYIVEGRGVLAAATNNYTTPANYANEYGRLSSRCAAIYITYTPTGSSTPVVLPTIIEVIDD